MYNPLEYDLVSLERRQRAEAARRYVVRTSAVGDTELRQRAGRERTPDTARRRDHLADALASLRAAISPRSVDSCDRRAQGAH